MAFFETLWKVLTYLSGNAKISLAIATLAMIFITFRDIKSLLTVLTDYFRSINIRRIARIVLAIFLIVSVYIIEIYFNTDSFTAEQFSIKTSLGSLNAGRYANIAAFISELNYIPVLNQNYGQSMLAAIPLILGFNSPFLALNFWLSLSVIFMCLVFNGFFIMLGLNNLMSLAGSILLMIGNTALSLYAIIVVDSGNPLFLSGYTDAIFSVGSFFGFLMLLKNFYDDQIKSALHFSIVVSILCISWSFSAPQNIVLSSILFSIISVIMLVKKRLSRKCKLLYASMLIFVLAGLTQGGLLTPEQMCDNVEIPGVTGAVNNNRRGPSIHAMFEFPYFHLYQGKWVYGMFYEKREIYQAIEEDKKSVNKPVEYSLYDMYYALWYEIENDFFNSLRITFFPLFGLVLPWFISGFRKVSLDDDLSNIKKLWFASLVIFLLGYFIVFLGDFNGYKWELSRFMLLGYAISPICFLAGMNIILKKISKRNSWLIIFIVMFVMTFGPITLVISQIRKNVFDSGNNKVLPFSERFNMLVNLQGIQVMPKPILKK
jgi:hypothetical protein